MRILVSACLLGVHCRYDGRDNGTEAVMALAKDHTLIPVCAEQLGGLPTPRPPVEWSGDRAWNTQGEDCTEAFRRGAEEVLHLARLSGCQLAVLKARSPSCGNRQIYDGQFRKQLIDGMGATARLLSENGIPVINETEVEAWAADQATRKYDNTMKDMP